MYHLNNSAEIIEINAYQKLAQIVSLLYFSNIKSIEQAIRNAQHKISKDFPFSIEENPKN